MKKILVLSAVALMGLATTMAQEPVKRQVNKEPEVLHQKELKAEAPAKRLDNVKIDRQGKRTVRRDSLKGRNLQPVNSKVRKDIKRADIKAQRTDLKAEKREVNIEKTNINVSR